MPVSSATSAPARSEPSWSRAGANTASDHITVLDQALAQIPDAHRHVASSFLQGQVCGIRKRSRRPPRVRRAATCSSR
ncbi:hypothetical protein [Streptomyces sp. NPDC020996]|uniref:hypothetical protein n=1 Tax=Streptomyces sp. NPDC020996 TaxID=3154791 RepID=UPI0033DB1F91